MTKGHQIKAKIKVEEFLQNIEHFTQNNVYISPHATFRFNKPQRKVFKESEIFHYILHETPRLVGIQSNGRYAVFYKYEKKTLKMILNIKPKKIKVVTVYTINNKQIPQLK